MAYMNDLYKFYENFSTWRIKVLGLEYRYLILISKAKPMANIIGQVHQEARTFINKTHIRDDSGIFGSVSFFSTSITEDVLLSEIGKFCGTKQEVLAQINKPPICAGGNNLWSSIGKGLQALRNLHTDGRRRKGRIFVFTDGYDVEGDFGEEDIARHNKEGIQKISKAAQECRIPVYLIALQRSEDDKWFWKILRRALTEAGGRVKWVTVTVLDDVAKVIRQFKQHHKDIHRDILKVCTLENFAWRFLAHQFPPPRWYLYPGLALCMYLEQNRVGEENLQELSPVIPVADLKQTLSGFVEDIIEQETVAPTIQAYVEFPGDFDKQQYRKWIIQDKFLENYVDLVLDTMLRAGWVHESKESGGSDVIVRRPGGPDEEAKWLITNLMDKYFFTEAWNDPKESTKERPQLKKLMRDFFNGPPLPVISQEDLEAVWPL